MHCLHISIEMLALLNLVATPFGLLASDDRGTGAVWIFYQDIDGFKPRPGDKLVGPSSSGANQGLSWLY